MKRVIHVVGARPNYMKIAPIMRWMACHPEKWRQILVHTGQHYDHKMSKIFFEDLHLPEPDVYLGAGSGSHATQYARIMVSFEKVLQETRPDWVIVVGDVNSTLACALVAAQMQIQVAHVEAGLRSFDRSMPEEINRVLTDHLSQLLFTTEPSGRQNLANEGIPAHRIRFVGNTMIDTLLSALPLTENRAILTDLGLMGQHGRCAGKQIAKYTLVTVHRPGNVDNPVALKMILNALERIANQNPVIFPVHPRTRRRIEEWGVAWRGSRIKLLDPLGYLDFIGLMRYAALVITDSGGVQEETTYLNIPCLTVRPNTERPITLQIGTNRLVRTDEEEIVAAASQALSGVWPRRREIPPLWDGRAAERIVMQLEQAE